MDMLHPFENESESSSFGNLTIENRSDRVTIYGDIDLTRDKIGLDHARHLKKIIDRVVTALENTQDLPETISPPIPTKPIRNPFS